MVRVAHMTSGGKTKEEAVLSESRIRRIANVHLRELRDKSLNRGLGAMTEFDVMAHGAQDLRDRLLRAVHRSDKKRIE